MTYKQIALHLFALIILMVPSQAQNLFTDGSFENYQIKPGYIVDPSTATGYIGGWQFLGNAGIINAGSGANLTKLSPNLSSAPAAPQGTQYAYLQTNRSGPSNNTTTNTDGIIYQTVNFAAAGNYTLTLSSRLVDSNSSGFNTTFTTYYMVEVDPQGQPGPNFKNIPLYASPEMDIGGCQHAISDTGFNTSTLTFYIPTVGKHVIALVSGGPTIFTNSITLIDNINLTPAKVNSVSQVVITSVPQSMAIGVPSEEFDVQLEDSNGLPTDAPTGGITLNLTDGAGGIFSLSPGGTPISSLNIPVGKHLSSFFYQTSSAGTHTVSISSPRLAAPATQVQTVVDPQRITFIHQFVPPNPNPQNLHPNFLVDGNSTTPLVFHGLNLAGWLEMEGYEVPIDSGGGEKSGTGISDMYTAISTLDSRFGVATEQKLLNTYQVNWISDVDIQNIHNAGMDIIRVPFWWANLYTLDHQWRPDAFTALDWVVAEAQKYNMKVLLDLHGTFGSESYNLWSGTANLNRYWESPYYQNKTDELWKRIATHYKYNNTVIGYDIINEPDGTPGNSTATIQATEDRLYKDIRSIDTNHLVVVELTGGKWGWGNLSSPQSYGWSNVAYSTHLYGTQSQIPQEVSGFSRQTNVPDMVGESNLQFDSVNLVNALTTFNRTGPGISFMFWGYKEANNNGNWGLYDNGSLAYGAGGTGSYQSRGGYAGGLGIIPSLMQDSAQTIANKWASWTTAGTDPKGQYLDTYLPSQSCSANFFVNYSIYDALLSVLQPAVALQEGLLTPSNPSPSNLVLGRNFGFEFPPIPPDTTGDHVGSDYIFRTNYSDSVNPIDGGWTFVTTGGDCGITGTGIKGGAISGDTVPPIPLSQTNSPEAFEGGLGLPPQPGQPSFGSPAQLNPAINLPPFNHPQLAYIKGTASFYQTVTSTETGPWQISYSSTLAPKSSSQPITVSVIPIAGSPSGSLTYTSGAVNPGTTSVQGTPVAGTNFIMYTFKTPSFTAGSYRLQFTGTGSGTALLSNVQVFVQQGSAQTQTITFGALPNVSYSATPIILNATASSGLTVTYTVTGPATVSGNKLTLTGTGPVVVTASQSGNTTYAAANPVTQSFSVSTAAQTITFGALPNVSYSTTPITLNATASSGLIVTYTVTGPATVSGNKLTLTGTGLVVVIASQSGNATYAAATPVRQSFSVSTAAQTITFGALPNVSYSTTPITLNATASSGLTVTYTVVSGPATLFGNTLTLTGGGTVTVKASQAGDSVYAAAASVQLSFNVLTTTQTINFAALPNVPYGTAPIMLSATASSGLPIRFSLVSGPATLSGNILTLTGAGIVKVEADQGGNSNYAAAVPVQQSFMVTPATQTVTFTALPKIQYGTAPIKLSATASSGLPVNFSLVSGPATLSGNTLTLSGAGLVVVQANQPGNINYGAATPVQQSFTVTKVVATPVISLPSGTYNTPQTVSITCATPGSTMHYTIDGTQPTALSTLYTGSLLISSSVKLQVIAVASGLQTSVTASTQYQINTLALAVNYGAGFTSSPALILNGGASIVGSALTLTDGKNNENRNAFFLKKVNVQNFTNNFTFQLTNPNADGFTFTIQGNSSSLTASQGYGGGLGYAGIPHSIAVKFDLYNNAGEGVNSTGIYVNGTVPSTPAIDLTNKINLHSGDVFKVGMIYDGKTLAVTLTDTVTSQSLTTNYAINIPGIVGGNSAYIGFTAGTGGQTATQKILTWTYLESVPSYLSGFTEDGLVLNGGASIVGPNLQLTTTESNESRSAFYPIPINITSFTTSFVFQLEKPDADGMTFCLQNVSANQVGAGGAGLGYEGIANSVAIKFDLYNNQGEGINSTGLYSHGVQPSLPAIDLTNSGINLHSGDPIQVDVSYIGKVLTVIETDSITGGTAQQQYLVDIPQIVGGNTAFIGFTAGTGGSSANQTILNWSF